MDEKKITAVAVPTNFQRESDLIHTVTAAVLAKYDKNTMPDVRTISDEVLDAVRTEIDLENSVRCTGDKFRKPRDLQPMQVAMIIVAKYYVGTLVFDKTLKQETQPLVIYNEDEGIYSLDENVLRRVIRQFKPNMINRDVTETMTYIKDMSSTIFLNDDPKFIAVNNGIFDYENKLLLPFSPDYVFISKSGVNYNPNAKNITIHNDADGTDWDVESWMNSLNDDAEVVHLLWQLLGAVIRPSTPWNKAALLMATSGRNGKGTLCTLMRALCGPGTHVSISLENFGKEFMLEPLTSGATAIISDESKVGLYLDDAASFKAIVTSDPLLINRKGRPPVNYKFKGMVVMCLNEMSPKIRDKSDSLMRRLLLIPFPKSFAESAERKYIKNDYLLRTEVLEYVLYKVLHDMTYYELAVPEVCKMALEDYKQDVDIMRQFVDDILPQLKWDLVPFTFLYDMFKAYAKKYSPKTNVFCNAEFNNNLLDLLEDNQEWSCEDKRKSVRPKQMMSLPEPLIDEYGLADWQNSRYRNSLDWEKRCVPDLKKSYRGILRNTSLSDTDD